MRQHEHTVDPNCDRFPKSLWAGLTLIAVTIGVCFTAIPVTAVPLARPDGRNIIIFVPDGLRPGSVNAADAPMMCWIREHGVNFINTHSVFPTLTMANASAIATGHYLGDTGVFGNVVFSGYPLFNTGNFGRTAAGTNTPFIENDVSLGDLDDHYDGNWIDDQTLLAAARADGFDTAVIGKLGPAALQDIAELDPASGKFGTPQTQIIDDWTGTADGVPIRDDLLLALSGAGLPRGTPFRVQPAGNATVPGTSYPNFGQQVYFVEAATRVILPKFKREGKPFVMVYWSRDPDGTQHTNGDSLNRLRPGINGPTSRAAIRNADDNLRQIWNSVQADPAVAANTDFFVVSDHGFATISKYQIDAAGHVTTSYAARHAYRDRNGAQEVKSGFLPPGFLAIDLAHHLQLPLFDPDSQVRDEREQVYEPVDPTASLPTSMIRQYPAAGNGLIGGAGRISTQTDAQVIVCANGGSDLIYLPQHGSGLLRTIITFLAEQDYVGGLFVDDRYGNVPGALPMSSLSLVGSAKLPRPDMVVAFKTFALDPKSPLMTAVQIADTSYQEGQGNHGSIARDNTLNFMVAIGPDFKKRFVDNVPVSNADVMPTIAQILGLSVSPRGELTGRPIAEALMGGETNIVHRRRTLVSDPTADSSRTVVNIQQIGSEIYIDQGSFRKRARGFGKYSSESYR